MAKERPQQTIHRYPILVNALGQAVEARREHLNSNQHGPYRIDFNHAEPNQSDLNEYYKKWDPNAYQQWCRLQIEQADVLERLLAHTFTRARPINYGEIQFTVAPLKIM